MNTAAPHSALREWRAHMAQPARAASLLGAAVILTLVGPFNTDEVLRALPRFVYWLAIVGICYSVGYLGNALADHFAMGARLLKRMAIAVPATSLGVLAVITLINGFALDFWPIGKAFLMVACNVIAISAVISVIFMVADYGQATQADTPPPLLDRLPFDKRGGLVSISVEDHYVRVRTTAGEEMVLLRLADAIREVGSTHGLQVHRSHWAALNQVTVATRKGDGAILTMTLGPDIPVSRANVVKLKEAGLLPR